MLGSMRKILDKHQKKLLVALAVVLMVGWTVLGRRGRAPDHRDVVIGTLYGHDITRGQVQSLRDRWAALELPGFTRDWTHTYMLLLAARHYGIRVGDRAVRRMIRQDPPQRQRIEYVLADPARLASEMKPTEDQIKAYYAERWSDRSQPLDKIRKKVEAALKRDLAKRAAARRIRAAWEEVRAMPREGNAYLGSFRRVAARHGLLFRRTPEPGFAERSAADALPELAEQVPAGDGRPRAQRRLPPDFQNTLFRIPVGEPSDRIYRSGDRLFFFRVIASRAGYTPRGTWDNKDRGWRNGRFVVTKVYRSPTQLIKARRRLDLSDIHRTFQEFLTVKKFVELACGGAGEAELADYHTTAFVPRDTADLIARLRRERVRGLVASVPAGPFRDDRPIPEDALARFYDARKDRFPSRTDFGYRQPERIRIEYVLADPAQFTDRVQVGQAELRKHYDDYKSSRFENQPFDKVKAAVEQDLRRAKARRLAASLLKRIKRQAKDPTTEEPLDLAPIAREAGLTYRTSRSFGWSEAWQAVPDLARSPEFLRQAFSPGIRPASRPGPGGGRVFLRPDSPTLEADGKLFFFRLLQHTPPRSLNFADIPSRLRARVEEDFRSYRALEAAEDAARRLKAGIASALIRRIALENKRAVNTAVLDPAAPDKSGLPAELLAYITQKLHRDAAENPLPGEIARLVRAGDAYYTAAVTRVDPQGAARIAFFSLTPGQFVAAVEPSPDAVAARAEALRDAALEKVGGRKPGTPAPAPSQAQKEQARKELLDEWKKKDFPSRYLDYLTDRLARVFREYIQDHPPRIARERRPVPAASRGFFRPDDEDWIESDKKLTAAAFQLEPGQLSDVVRGDTGAAVLFLEAEQTRKNERKIEFLSLHPDRYPALDFPVPLAEARKYYEAHRAEFDRPPRARAEFLLAPFQDIARALEPNITDAEIKAYHQKHHPGRTLDDALTRQIRSLLSQARARDQAEKAIRAAHAAAAKTPDVPLAKIADSLKQRATLKPGLTPMLTKDHSRIDAIGFAPDLVRQICSAKKGSLSRPVKVEAGWVLFRVTERVEKRRPAFEEVLPAVRARVRDRRRMARARRALEAIRAVLAAGKAKTIEEARRLPDIAVLLPRNAWAVRVQTSRYMDFDHAVGVQAPAYMTRALRAAVFDPKLRPGQTTPVVESKAEGLQFARLIGEKTHRLVKVRYLYLPAEWFASTIQVRREEAEQYYRAHRADYKAPRRYELEYVLARAESLAPDIQPTDEELRAAYEQIKQEFIDPEASKAGSVAYRPFRDVRQQLAYRLSRQRAMQQADDLAARAAAAAGKDKARPLKKIAAQIGKLEHRAGVEYERGGARTPWFLREVPGLDAFLARAKPGDTSPALPTHYGALVVRLTRVLPERVPPFDEVRSRVTRDAARERGLAQAVEMMRKLRSQIKAPEKPTPDAMDKALAEAAKKFPVQTLRAVTVTVFETKLRARGEQEPSSARLVPRLFRLRFGEISEPPIRDGDRAEACLLAILTEMTLGPPSEVDTNELRQRAAQSAYDTRLRNLLQWVITRDFRPARRQ